MPACSVGTSYLFDSRYPKTSVTKGHKGVLTLSLCPRLRIRLHYYFFIELVMIILTDEYIYISMKKLLLSLLLILPLCGFAQKGMQGVGFNFGGGTGYDRDCLLGEFSLKYQNYIKDNIRISPHMKYYNLDDYNEYEGFYLGCDFHGFFTKVRRLRAYAIVGLSLGSTTEYVNDYEDDYTYFDVCIDLGIGIDYRIGYHFSLQGEFSPFYGYLSQAGLLHPFYIGLTYTF